MNKFTNYIRDSYHELVYKVSWPTWAELQSSTMIVLVSTIIITLMIWGMDTATHAVLSQYYKMLQ
jgi:preprotein translocase subunit SecE